MKFAVGDEVRSEYRGRGVVIETKDGLVYSNDHYPIIVNFDDKSSINFSLDGEYLIGHPETHKHNIRKLTKLDKALK